MNNSRWIEIQFAIFIKNLNRSLKNFIIVTDYIELLARAANIDSSDALVLLQKVFNSRDLIPSNPEFICLAKKNNVVIDKIIKSLHISKRDYIKAYHELDLTIEIPSRCTKKEIETMQALLDAHKKFKEAMI